MTDLPLTTSRLMLRDFEEDDLPSVRAWRADSEVARFMDFDPETLEQSRDWLNAAIFHNAKRPRVAYNFAIVHRETRTTIGWIGIGPSSRYPESGEFGVGYAVSSRFWGAGYATEALRAVLGLAFDALRARRVSAWCFVDNVASVRVMEKSGMRFERRYSLIEPKSGAEAECVEYAVRAQTWSAL
ncbi:MAG: N-acetyltransferase [Chloroflexota bacterium]|nr:MAG: N-acetyltransferase [Chloroflexota bacterium]